VGGGAGGCPEGGGGGEGNRVSTISLLGCSTSVALVTGPTDEGGEEKEEEEEEEDSDWLPSYIRAM